MDNLVGKTLGQYQLVEIIHQGENTVYKGFQPSLNRYVAVKVLNPARSQDLEFSQQFRRDMQLIVSLEHPNILSVYDYGQEEGLLYMVTRYIETGSLQDRLPPPFSLEQAQQMINGITDALDLIHSRGVIHGNLKPANILIDELGQPVLTDFGYTQGIDVGEQESVYLSPEQAQGVAADRRTDVYALGVLLYEMVIGEPPALGVVPTPRARRPDLPVEVEQVILKAMAQYPDQRFQTAGELNHALNLAVPGQAAVYAQPTPVAAATPAAAAEPESARSPWGWIVAGVAIVGLLALLACFFFAILFGGDEGDGDTTAPSVPTPTLAADTPTPVPTPEPDQPPAAVIDGPQNAQVGESVAFSGANSQVASGSRIVNYEWNFDDGTSNSGMNVSHVFKDSGTYRVELTVTDDKGLNSATTHQIKIEAAPEPPEPEEPPTVVIDGPTEAEVGETVTFSARDSQCANKCVSYTWDLGDGTTANAVRIDHVYNTAGIFNVVLTVTDEQGLQGTTNHQIEITAVEAEQPVEPPAE